MKRTILTLLLLSLTLTGCIVEPGRGYRDAPRGESHGDHGDHRGWGR